VVSSRPGAAVTTGDLGNTLELTNGFVLSTVTPSKPGAGLTTDKSWLPITVVDDGPTLGVSSGCLSPSCCCFTSGVLGTLDIGAKGFWVVISAGEACWRASAVLSVADDKDNVSELGVPGADIAGGNKANGCCNSKSVFSLNCCCNHSIFAVRPSRS